METRFTEDQDAQLFTIYQDGKRAGFIDYDLHDNEIELLHTEVDSQFRGQGIAGKLTRHVLDEARKRGYKVLPWCPYVRNWISKHPEYLDLVPEKDLSSFEL